MLKLRRCYVVDTGAALADSFITQTREICGANSEKKKG